MPITSEYPLIPVSQALDAVLAEVRPGPAVEVPLRSAFGRTLGQDVYADADLPGSPRSSVDGYAVVSGDDSDERRILEEVTAGRLARSKVGLGTAVRIMTGGLLPEGADAVVMVEDADELPDNHVQLHVRAQQGDNVHPRAMDLAAGQLVLSRGVRIGASEIGLLATVGQAQVSVYRRPRVAVLATGDELVEPHEAPPPGSIRDSNRFALMAAAVEAGAEVVWEAKGRDDEAVLEQLAREALAQADVLLTSGGVSMGTRDLVKPLMRELGSVHFGRVLFKPGKPLTFATTGSGQLIFGLPGFPVSSLVTFEVFVRPALLALGGRRQVRRPVVEVVLSHELRPDLSRLEYQRAIVAWRGSGFEARTTGVQASSRLLSTAGANALLEIQPAREVLPAGSRVQALLLADL